MALWYDLKKKQKKWEGNEHYVLFHKGFNYSAY